MQQRIYLKFTEGYVKIAHIIENDNIIKIALDQENPAKWQRHTELTIHDFKIHIKDLGYKKFFKNDNEKFSFTGDPPENEGYPYEIKINNQSVGYKNLPSNILLPLHMRTYTSGIPKSFLSQTMNKEGQVLVLNQSCIDRLSLEISFKTGNAKNLNNTEDKLVMKTSKGTVIFSANAS